MNRTTHLAVAAHQDDIEIMAYHGISQCYGSKSKWLTGVTVTNGASSPRAGKYRNFSPEQMKGQRKKEQHQAAKIGKFGLMIQLGHDSKNVKHGLRRREIQMQLHDIFMNCRPEIVYTHNLADKHDTHVAVALATIEAIRKMPPKLRPKSVLGCEVWRDLDWLMDDQKIVLPVSERPRLAEKLCRIFDSQISGGKRYDLGAMGRRLANATFFESEKVDQETHLSFAMDLTPLIRSTVRPEELVARHILEFRSDVLNRLRRFKY
jgi:LmbE family N-acetylglucosaminyl deacetylase